MTETDVKKLIIKDPKTYGFYKKRAELFTALLDAYEAKKEYCETTKLSAEMDAIHFQTLIMQVNDIKELNDQQMHQQYNFDKEQTIIKKYQELSIGDFTENEKKTLEYYANKIKNAEERYEQIMQKIIEIQQELNKEVKKIWGYQLTLPFSSLATELFKIN